MSAFELTGTITALANAIAYNLTADEIILLACIFVQLGDTLATISTVNASLQNKEKVI